MDRRISSVSSSKSSDSGYSSNSELKEYAGPENSFFAKLIKNLWENPSDWSSHLENFKKEINYQAEKNKQQSVPSISKVLKENNSSGRDKNKSSFSWESVDSAIFLSEYWDNDRENQGYCSSLIEIAKTRASLETGFINQLILEYSETYGNEWKKVLSTKDRFSNNILHCIANVISNKINYHEKISESDWEVYQDIVEDSKFWKVELEQQKNSWGVTPSDIIIEAGLKIGVEVYSFDF